MKRRKHPEQLTWAPNPGRAVRVTTVGDRRALVENHLGIDAYGPEAVRLRCRGGAVCLRGRDLSLREVRAGALIVAGVLDGVELEHDSPAG
ncbi:MAG TPA: YabP/YqfC family sporulation protein [Candidatus Pullichristensenella avicola]|nr:YabP/YqfC family sporulation protein [Candidatus Pullichristensenella avicola]